MSRLLAGAARGVAAGLAGTAALNATTYLDMAVRARPASSTPEDSVEQLSQRLGVDIPGDQETRDNRVRGLAPLLGIAAGVGTGVVVAGLRELGVARGPVALTALSFVTSTVSGNAPMAAMGISDPRSWSATDWAADAVPHAAYAAVTAAVISAMDR